MFSKSFTKTVLTHLIHPKRFIKTLSLKFRTNGEPLDVLKLVEEELPEPHDFQVLIKVLMAPINPADLYIVQGRYPLQPSKFPATGGNEFVGEIVKLGEKVENFILNEHVVAFESGLGTWSKYLLLDAKQIYPIPDKLNLPEAATLTVSPCTAYRMLKDFVKLKPGDCVIQNGANGAVGQAVHQLCKHWGFKSIGVVRDREDVVNLKQYLQRLGATEVFTEAEVIQTELFKTGCLPKPILALNCVGGDSAVTIAKFLEHKGVMVTYGGISLKPVTISTGNMIFKRHSFHGFWNTDWNKRNAHTVQRNNMLMDLIELMTGAFQAPCHSLIPFEEFPKYANKILKPSGKSNQKFIFDMRPKIAGAFSGCSGQSK